MYTFNQCSNWGFEWSLPCNTGGNYEEEDLGIGFWNEGGVNEATVNDGVVGVESGLVNVRVVEFGAIDDNESDRDDDDDYDGDSYRDFGWISNNGDEKIQETRADFNKLKRDKDKKKTVGDQDMHPEMDF